MTIGIKTSEFWTHVAVLLTSGAAVLGTVFDKGFLNSHPVFSAVTAGVAMVLAGASQVAYVIGRSIVKSNSAPSLG